MVSEKLRLQPRLDGGPKRCGPHRCEPAARCRRANIPRPPMCPALTCQWRSSSHDERKMPNTRETDDAVLREETGRAGHGPCRIGTRNVDYRAMNRGARTLWSSRVFGLSLLPLEITAHSRLRYGPCTWYQPSARTAMAVRSCDGPARRRPLSEKHRQAGVRRLTQGHRDHIWRTRSGSRASGSVTQCIENIAAANQIASGIDRRTDTDECRRRISLVPGHSTPASLLRASIRMPNARASITKAPVPSVHSSQANSAQNWRGTSGADAGNTPPR